MKHLEAIEGQERMSSPDRRHAKRRRRVEREPADFIAEEDQAPTCPICLADIVEHSKAIVNPCMHVYCRSCLDQWLHHKRLCPLCKGRVCSYMYDIRSDQIYSEHVVPPSPPPKDSALLDWSTHYSGAGPSVPSAREQWDSQMAVLAARYPLAAGLHASSRPSGFVHAMDAASYRSMPSSRQAVAGSGARYSGGSSYVRPIGSSTVGPTGVIQPRPYYWRLQRHMTASIASRAAADGRGTGSLAFAPGSLSEDPAIRARHAIYSAGMWAVPVSSRSDSSIGVGAAGARGSGAGSAVITTATVVRGNSSIRNRHLESFVERDLRVLLHEEDVTIVRAFVMGLVNSIGFQSPAQPVAAVAAAAEPITHAARSTADAIITPAPRACTTTGVSCLPPLLSSSSVRRGSSVSTAGSSRHSMWAGLGSRPHNMGLVTLSAGEQMTGSSQSGSSRRPVRLLGSAIATATPAAVAAPAAVAPSEVVEDRQLSSPVTALQDFLFENAAHFWHEIRNFALSSLSIAAYDETVTFQPSGNSGAAPSSPHPSIASPVNPLNPGSQQQAMRSISSPPAPAVPSQFPLSVVIQLDPWDVHDLTLLTSSGDDEDGPLTVLTSAQTSAGRPSLVARAVNGSSRRAQQTQNGSVRVALDACTEPPSSAPPLHAELLEPQQSQPRQRHRSSRWDVLPVTSPHTEAASDAQEGEDHSLHSRDRRPGVQTNMQGSIHHAAGTRIETGEHHNQAQATNEQQQQEASSEDPLPQADDQVPASTSPAPPDRQPSLHRHRHSRSHQRRDSHSDSGPREKSKHRDKDRHRDHHHRRHSETGGHSSSHHGHSDRGRPDDADPSSELVSRKAANAGDRGRTQDVEIKESLYFSHSSAKQLARDSCGKQHHHNMHERVNHLSHFPPPRTSSRQKRDTSPQGQHRHLDQTTSHHRERSTDTFVDRPIVPTRQAVVEGALFTIALSNEGIAVRQYGDECDDRWQMACSPELDSHYS